MRVLRFRRHCQPPLLWVLIVTVATTSADSGAAADAENNESRLKQRVQTLIRDLDADDRRTRVSSERALVEFGPNILVLLPAPGDVSGPQVGNAIDRIRTQIAARMVEMEQQPSRVSLSGQPRLAEFVQRLVDQTGNRIQLRGLSKITPDTRIDAGLDDVTFWEAVDGLCAHHALRVDAQERRLQIAAAEESFEGQIRYSGPFRIVAAPPRIRPLPGRPDTWLLRLTIELWWEPRLHPLLVHKRPGAITATLDDKSEAPLFSPLASVDLPAGTRRCHISLREDFVIPTRAIGSAIDVRGKLNVQLAVARHEFRFVDWPMPAPGNQRFGSVSVGISESTLDMSDAGDSYDLDVAFRVAFESRDRILESHRNWIVRNPIRIETESGRLIQSSARATTQLAGNNAVVVDCRLRGVPGNPHDHRLVYETPTAVVDVPVEFEFHGLAIPAPSRKVPDD